MGQLAIVVTVDQQGALASGQLAGNIYLIDNNKHAGSTGEGTEDLVTHIEGSQIMNWLVLGLDLQGPAVTLENVCGEAVEKGIMVPQQFESPELGAGLGLWWGATVDSSEKEQSYSYTLKFKIGDKPMSYDGQIVVKKGFSNVPSKPCGAHKK